MKNNSIHLKCQTLLTLYKTKIFVKDKILILIMLMFLSAYNIQAQSPVAVNGKLSVSGTSLVNSSGTPVQLRGMSSHGVQWYTEDYNFNSLSVLTKNWGIDVFRIAMYPTDLPDQTKSAYEGNPTFWRSYVDNLVDVTGSLGIYCIIDWHVLTPGDPTDARYYQMAKDFWDYMSKKHAGKSHVIYEICNEPNGVSWSTVKSYAETIISIIRNNDPSSVIIVGSPTWSSDVDIAANDPIKDPANTSQLAKNVMYTFHFYAASHGQNYRDKITTAMSKGLPIFVTEWGSTDASGAGGSNWSETQTWIDYMQQRKISWCNWSYSDKPETSAVLQPGSGASLLWDNTNDQGNKIKAYIASPADSWNSSGNWKPAAGISSPLNNDYFLPNTPVVLKADAVDKDGTISSVEYFVNGSSAGTATSAPYNVMWTPTALGNYTVTAVAKDNAGATGTSVAFTYHVVSNFNQTAYPNGTAWAIPGTIECKNFDNGGEMIAYHDLDAVHKGPANSDRASDGVDVEGTNNVGYVLTGEWLEYTVNVASAGSYDFTLQVASGLSGVGKFHLESNGISVTPVTDAPSSGNWGSYQPVTIKGIALSAGIQVIKLYVDRGNFNFSNMKFVAGTSSTFTITASSDVNGSITPSGSVAVAANTNKTFTFAPNTGFVINTLTVDGAAVTSPGTSYTFSNVTANHTIAVTYKTTNGNNNPIPSFTATPTTGTAPLAVAFNASASSDPDGDALTYTWNFGDNTSATGVTASHTYSGVGNYSAVLTVSDGKGGTATSATQISVSNVNNTGYFGTLPTNITTTDALASYNAFKTKYFEACGNGSIRVKWDDLSKTVSEGIGYGMLLAAFANDHTSFDGLYKYYKSFLNTHGFMHWQISGCTSVIGQNGATDADLDVAMALIMADNFWKTNGAFNYKTEATDLISKIKQFEVEANTNVLKPGDMFGGSNETNISYFATAYFKAFGAFTNDVSYWNAVADKCYEIIFNNLSKNNAVGGLVSDWCAATGLQAPGRTLNYGYDACRTPWRISLDYYWNGDARAKSYMDKTNSFINSIGIANVKDGYKQDGTPTSIYHNTTFVGTFACAGIASTQTVVNNYYTELSGIQAFGYFDYIFDAFAKFLLSGLTTKPGGVAVDQFTINASASTGGSISPSGSVQVTKGGNISFTITPNAGATITDVKVDGTSVGKVTSYTFTNVISNHTIAATFDGGANQNLALSRPVTVSSTEANYGNVAANAVDGIASTRWSSLYADPQWIQVDLGSTYNIQSVVLNWETASAKDYKVEASTDGNTWTTLVTKAGMPNGPRVDNLTGLSGSARYVRMTGTARNTQWGYSLYELEVYGTTVSNIGVTGVTLTPTTATLNVGQTQQLIAAVAPTNATNKNVSFTTSNANVASVNASGLVIAVANGTVTITVTTQDGNKTATSTITVSTTNVAVTSVALTPTSVSLSAAGQTQQLTATVAPSTATNKNVTYASSNSNVASVNASGLVTAVANGTATITVTTQDGGKTATSSVSVNISGCSLLTKYSVPRSSALSSMNTTFPFVFVLGSGGPNLSNVTSFVIQWDLQYSGLWQFALNTNNGVPDWYVNLVSKTTNTFSSSSPACKISGSGIAGLDGDYWVNMDGSNFVMVAKSGSYAIYASTTSTAPSACGARVATSETTSGLNAVSIYPTELSVNEVLHVTLPGNVSKSNFSIFDISGRRLKQADVKSNHVEINIDYTFNKGMYLLNINSGSNAYMKKFIVK